VNHAVRPPGRTIHPVTFPYVSLPRPSPEDHAALGDLPGLTRKAAKRSYPPGQHGQARRKRSEYAIRLEEKQKLRFNYGISERQLVRYVKKARAQEGSTGTNLLKLLENRLDNICFRLGSVPPSRAPASWSTMAT
jgi:small subunit ribosomal protein S4